MPRPAVYREVAAIGDLIPQLIASGITAGSIYALVALGFTLIFNATDVINFAQGEFVVLGGLLYVSFHRAGLPVLVCVLLVIVVTALFGALIERGLISPVKRGSVMTLVIITLGVSVVIKNGALLLWGPNPLFAQPFTSGKAIRIFGAAVLPQMFWVIGVSLVLMVGLSAFYRYSSVGRAMLACAIDRHAAYLMGINVQAMVLLSFVLSAAFGALAGVMVAPIANVSYNQGFGMALKGFAGAALGGFGNSAGAIAGGFLLGLIESLAVGFLPSGYKEMVGLLVLLLVLMVRPSGLLGGREERRHTATL